MHFPEPLKVGSTIAITAFSSGIEDRYEARYQIVLDDLKARGFNVTEGSCLRSRKKYESAPAAKRARELMGFLLDDSIDAIAPPWGGELAMELLPLLDFEKLKSAKPKWIFGFSDVSTITAVFTSKLAWATAHCSNLMDLTNNATDPLISNTLNYLSTDRSGEFKQLSSKKHTRTWPAIEKNPSAILQPDTDTNWRWLVRPESGNEIRGRLIGGCWDTLFHLFGTEYLDLQNLSDQYPEGLLLYLENVEMSPAELTRTILNMKFRGVFDCISGLLLGRCSVKDSENESDLQYYEVLDRHLSSLKIPVMIDLDIGHVPPNLTLINGASAAVSLDHNGSILQRLV